MKQFHEEELYSRNSKWLILGVFLIVVLSAFLVLRYAEHAGKKPSGAAAEGNMVFSFTGDGTEGTTTATRWEAASSSEEGTGSPATTTASSDTETTPEANDSSEWLPEGDYDVYPERYNLSIKIYLPGYGTPIAGKDKYKFEGTLVVKMKARRNTTEIVLNQTNLKGFHAEYVWTENETRIAIVNISRNHARQQVNFTLEEPLVPGGNYYMRVTYRGKILRDGKGLYMSAYKDTTEWMFAATTQMEPDYGRRVVPCFDEPKFKAIWDVTVIHPKDTAALSNGIEISEETVKEEDGLWMKTRFASTPIMPSYLLAISVFRYSYLEAYTKGNVRVRVYAPMPEIEDGKFALNATITCLEFFESRYKVPYPLKKLDMVSIDEFEAGAMENWGQITFRPSSLLYNKRGHFERKRFVSDTVVHELGHQWFGNLVTMNFWDEIWLNEGFATHTEAIGVDKVFDGAYEMEQRFVANYLEMALKRDRRPERALQPGPSSDNLKLFDYVAYQKGASFINMVRSIMGNEAFDAGILNYLRKYAYRNVHHWNLFAELDKMLPKGVADHNNKTLNLGKWSLPWLKQKGYPVVTMRPSTEAGRVEIYQESIVPDDNATWDVPIWLQRGPDTELEFYWLLRGQNLTVRYDPKEDTPLLMNADARLLGLTNYHPDLWEKIFQQLEKRHDVYPVNVRYSILYNAVTMTLLEKLDWKVAKKAFAYLRHETHDLPFNVFYGSIQPNRNGSSWYKKLLAHQYDNHKNILQIGRSVVDEATFVKNRLALESFSKFLLFSENHTQIAREIFETEYAAVCSVERGDLSSDCSKVPIVLRKDVYCAAFKFGFGENSTEKLLAMLGRETEPEERHRLNHGAACRHPGSGRKRGGSLLLTEARKAAHSPDRLIRLAEASAGLGSEFALDMLISQHRAASQASYKSSEAESSASVFPSEMAEILVGNIKNRKTLKALKTYANSKITEPGRLKDRLEEAILEAEIRISDSERMRELLENTTL